MHHDAGKGYQQHAQLAYTNARPKTDIEKEWFHDEADNMKNTHNNYTKKYG